MEVILHRTGSHSAWTLAYLYIYYSVIVESSLRLHGLSRIFIQVILRTLSTYFKLMHIFISFHSYSLSNAV